MTVATAAANTKVIDISSDDDDDNDEEGDRKMPARVIAPAIKQEDNHAIAPDIAGSTATSNPTSLTAFASAAIGDTGLHGNASTTTDDEEKDPHRQERNGALHGNASVTTNDEEEDPHHQEQNVALIAAWIAEDVLGPAPSLATIRKYAFILYQKGLETVDAIQQHLDPEEIEGFDWIFHMKIFSKKYKKELKKQQVIEKYI
jgi:hypothetical protein